MSDRGTLVASRMARISPPSFTHEDLLRRRERRVLRRRVTAAIVAVVAFGAVAVWGTLALRQPDRTPAAGESAKTIFVREAGAICQAGQAAFQRLVPLRSPRPTWPLEKKLEYYRTGLRIFGETAARLRALTPPPGLEEEVGAMLDPFERHLDAVARAIAAGEAGNRHTFARTIRRAFGPLADEAIAAFDEFDPDLSCP